MEPDKIQKASERGFSMRIILTVGHSILKSGNCTSADGRAYGGILEYSYNKTIVERIAAYLRSVGHTVDVLVCPELRFGTSTDEKSYKISRVNNGGYDMVAELHLNASKFHNSQGCEVLYVSPAGQEIALRIQQQLATVFNDRGIQHRSNLYMLTQTKPVSVMIEIFFCDNPADCRIAEKHDVALLIAQGIHGHTIQPNTNGQGAGFMYRVQTGAFAVKANAESLMKQLKGRGFSAFVTSVDLGQIIYRVQIGAFTVRANAEKLRENLHTAGFEAVIVIT